VSGEKNGDEKEFRSGQAMNTALVVAAGGIRNRAQAEETGFPRLQERHLAGVCHVGFECFDHAHGEGGLSLRLVAFLAAHALFQVDKALSSELLIAVNSFVLG
jgi:hypothetical protein